LLSPTSGRDAYWLKEVDVVPQASEQSNPSKGLRAKGPYTSLPKGIRREDTIAAKESDPPPDPQAGRDSERDFILRYSG
jgi:hypothetical protein